MKNPFTDPATEVEAKDRLRTSITYCRPTIAVLSRVHCRKGTEQITCNILLAKLAKALADAGLTEYDPDAYEHFVSQCRIVAPRTAKSRATGSPTA